MGKLLLSILVLFLLPFVSMAQKTTIVINEFMADNSSTISDPSGKFEDWIEIYNYGNVPIDIARMYFTDDFSNPVLFRIPEGNDTTIVQPNAHLLLWADGNWEEGIRHLEFKLSRKGEQIAIFDSDGKTIIDSVSFTMQNPDQSFGRKTDNDSVWIFFEKPSPGLPNSPKE